MPELVEVLMFVVLWAAVAGHRVAAVRQWPRYDDASTRFDVEGATPWSWLQPGDLVGRAVLELAARVVHVEVRRGEELYTLSFAFGRFGCLGFVHPRCFDVVDGHADFGRSSTKVFAVVMFETQRAGGRHGRKRRRRTAGGGRGGGGARRPSAELVRRGKER